MPSAISLLPIPSLRPMTRGPPAIVPPTWLSPATARPHGPAGGGAAGGGAVDWWWTGGPGRGGRAREEGRPGGGGGARRPGRAGGPAAASAGARSQGERRDPPLSVGRWATLRTFTA